MVGPILLQISSYDVSLFRQATEAEWEKAARGIDGPEKRTQKLSRRRLDRQHGLHAGRDAERSRSRHQDQLAGVPVRARSMQERADTQVSQATPKDE